MRDLFSLCRDEIEPKSKQDNGRPDLSPPAAWRTPTIQRTTKRATKKTVGIAIGRRDCPKRRAFFEDLEAKRNDSPTA